MGSNFFAYEYDLPQDVGFGIFGSWHVLWLLALGGLTVCLLRQYLGLSGKRRRVWEYAVAFSTVGLMAVRSVYVAVMAVPLLQELPLHLCSVAGILCALHCVTGAGWMGQVLYAIGLPGTVLALLFPDWGKYPAVHFITIEGFFFHAGILLYVAGQLCSKKIVPEYGKLWQVFLFLAAYLIPVCLFDRSYQVNYMFLSRPSAGSPLELLWSWFGDSGYLSVYVGLILLCTCLMDVLYQRILKKLILTF